MQRSAPYFEAPPSDMVLRVFFDDLADDWLIAEFNFMIHGYSADFSHYLNRWGHQSYVRGQYFVKDEGNALREIIYKLFQDGTGVEQIDCTKYTIKVNVNRAVGKERLISIITSAIQSGLNRTIEVERASEAKKVGGDPHRLGPHGE